MKQSSTTSIQKNLSDNWIKSKNLIKLLFNKQARSDIYQYISKIEWVKKISIYDVRYVEKRHSKKLLSLPLGQTSNDDVKLYSRLVKIYTSSKISKILLPKDIKKKSELINPNEPIYKAFFNVSNFTNKHPYHFLLSRCISKSLNLLFDHWYKWYRNLF